MTPPKRLTPEREAEIRAFLNDEIDVISKFHALRDCMEEIDYLRDSFLDMEFVRQNTYKNLLAVEKERDRLAMGALAGLSQFIATPEKGYVCEPEILQLDIERLGKERDALKAENEKLKEWKGFRGALVDNRIENQKLRERVAKLREAGNNLLATSAMEWALAAFHQDESPSGAKSGIIAKIHNHEKNQNVLRAFAELKKALAQDDEEEKT